MQHINPYRKAIPDLDLRTGNETICVGNKGKNLFSKNFPPDSKLVPFVEILTKFANRM